MLHALQWRLVAAICCSAIASAITYDPTWASLDQRPLPTWYDDAKVGIFLHWGVFSVPSFGGAWFWEAWQEKHEKDIVDFMKKNYPPGFTYQDFGPMFRAEFFDPVQWASIFNASGAQYVVLTSKHHEGFTLWPSKVSWNWNSRDIGPKRDLVGDLAAAIRTHQPHIHFGLYHSLFEWYNPLYLRDKCNNFSSSDFVNRKAMPELEELVSRYKPEIVWSDGDWEAPDWYWNSTKFIAWLFNESPVKDTVVVNDRWGQGTSCKHGSYYTCHDRFNPQTLQPHKWENCMTLDTLGWAYRRNAPATEYISIHDLITTLAETISCGGNLLVNAGPTSDGMIPAIMEERLRQLGLWLSLNGEAIYRSRPWQLQNDTLTPGVWYTSAGQTVYAIVLTWPADDVLILGAVSSTASTTITMLSDTQRQQLPFKELRKGLQVALPQQSAVTSQWAWVLKMTGVAPSLGASPQQNVNTYDEKENYIKRMYDKLSGYFS